MSPLKIPGGLSGPLMRDHAECAFGRDHSKIMYSIVQCALTGGSRQVPMVNSSCPWGPLDGLVALDLPLDGLVALDLPALKNLHLYDSGYCSSKPALLLCPVCLDRCL